MARIEFRQGIVRFQTDLFDSPTFLNLSGGTVSLIVSPDPTIITLAQGNKDYLFTEIASVSNAWSGPFVPGTDYWIYWDINLATGVRTFGHTELSPIISAQQPTSPQVGQMWWDSANNLMYEYNGANFVEVLRVFAARIVAGTTLQSVSDQTPNFRGTQVGLNVTADAGSLVFDSTGEPITTGDGSFFTTEDVFTTGVPTGGSIKVNAFLVEAIAQQPLAKGQVVEFINFNKVVPADPSNQNDVIFGMVEEDIFTNGLASIRTGGVLYNSDWDWSSAGVNAPLYIGTTGLLQETPVVPNQLSAAVVIDVDRVLLRDPSILSTIVETGSGGTSDHGSLTGLSGDDHLQYHNDTRGDIRYYEKSIADATFASIVHTHLEADITDLDKYTQAEVDLALTGKSDVGHTHLEADITDLDKYTQAEVDNLLAGKLSLTGGTMLGSLTLAADPTGLLEAATKQYVDSIAAGLDPKESVRIATTADVGGLYSPTSGTGGTGAFTGVDLSVAMDGIVPALGDRILVKDQTDAKQNGIYVVTVVGAAGEIERSLDMDGTPSNEVSPGNFTYIEEGTAGGGTNWMILGGTASGANNTIVLNTDDINWSQIAAGGAVAPTDQIIDADGDTSVTVEAAPDEDVIRFNAGGVPSHEVLTLSTAGLTASFPTAVSAGASISMTAGAGGFARPGGNVDVFGGLAGGGGEDGGTITLTGGNGQGGDGGATGGNVTLLPGSGDNADGKVILGIIGHKWPNIDGALGEVLTTDGSGNLSFAAVSASPPTRIEDGVDNDSFVDTSFGGANTEVVRIQAGTTALNGGPVQIEAGAGLSGAYGSGGTIDITGGAASAYVSQYAGSAGGGINITGGVGGQGVGPGGYGGSVTIAGGVGGNAGLASVSGDVILIPGAAAAFGGQAGQLRLGLADHKWPASDGSSGQALTTDGFGNLSFSTVGGGGSPAEITDADSDTRIRVEASADEDVIRFDTGNSNSPYPAVSNVLTLSSSGFALDFSSATPTSYGDGSGIALTAGTGYGAGQDGGGVSISAGPGGYAPPASGSGPGGGNLTLSAGLGGDAYDNSKGSGGNAIVSAGNGGINGTGYGDGGYTTIRSGNGSNSSASAYYRGGHGGGLNLYAGSGGSNAATTSGGNGGPVQIFAGDGGNHTGSGSPAGSDGGTIALTAGDAGNLTGSPATPNGDGGNIVLTPGAAGTGGTAGAGADGTVQLGLANLKFPNADGSVGDVLTTDGSGNLSFATPESLGLPYDLAFQIQGQAGTASPTNIGIFVATRAFTIQGSGHRANTIVGPTGSDTVFTIRYDAGGDGTGVVSLGTVTFTTAGGDNQSVSPTISSQAVSAGDVIIVELTTPDSNDILADATFTINATT